MRTVLQSRFVRRRPRRINILHRPLAVAAALLVCVLALPAQRAQKRSTGPRALGLIQLAPNGRARLIPISILIDGKFYDAAAYHADPLPMALEPETVYEAQRSGESVGLLTLTNAVTLAKNWYGLGQWRTNADIQKEKEKKDAPVAAAPKPVDDEPPVLRRPSEKSTPEAAPKPAEPKPAEAKPAEKASTKVEAKAEPAPTREDPDRPVLRRGKPAEKQTGDEVDPFTPPKSGAKPVDASVAGPIEIFPAISDAKGPETQSYVMQLKPDERQKYESKVRAAAYEAVMKFAKARPQHKPAPATELRDVQFKVFDVHHNNEPVLVMSASLPELARTGNFQYFVTVVARIDMYGDVHRLFAQVSDTNHLDAYRRLELIDVVDAQGTGSGQLLFRGVGDTDFVYAIYRVGSDQLWPLFESAPQGLRP